jgi:hypothetical protein
MLLLLCGLGCALSAQAAFAQPGGVARRITVRTNPPGAEVYIDNYEIGTSPCSTFFTYYGTREIRMVKDGFETLVVRQPIPAPWYEYLPFEFVADNFWPSKIHDERVVDFNLVPQQIVPTNQLLTRAEQLRRQTQPATPAFAPGAAIAPGAAAPGTAIGPGRYPLQPAIPPGQPPFIPTPAAPPYLPSNASPTGAQWSGSGIN